jgi:outer membrane immunogenic protein
MRANKIHLRSVAVAAGLAALLGAGTAYAADVVYEEPPAPVAPMETPPLNTWSGPYAGLAAGYGFAGSVTGATGGAITGASGWVFGGFGGYNWQNGGFVYGLEADIGYNGVNGNNGTTLFRNGLEGSLRARLGYAVSDNVLVYATAGGAGSQQQITDGAGTAVGSAFGWTAGAGTDVKLTEKMFGRLEYRYTDLGAVTLNTGSGAQTINSQNHRVMVGLGIKF